MFFSITEKNSLDIIFYVDFKQDWKNRMLLLEKCWIFLHSIDSTKHAMKLNQIILGVALFHVYVISCYHLFMNFLIQWPIWIIVSWSKFSTELWRCGHWMPYCRKVVMLIFMSAKNRLDVVYIQMYITYRLIIICFSGFEFELIWFLLFFYRIGKHVSYP